MVKAFQKTVDDFENIYVCIQDSKLATHFKIMFRCRGETQFTIIIKMIAKVENVHVWAKSHIWKYELKISGE